VHPDFKGTRASLAQPLTEAKALIVAKTACGPPPCQQNSSTTAMFSHIVIFWTDPANPKAADELIAGAKQYLTGIPGIERFHVGKMVASHRPVVDQSYQVALNLTFTSKQAQDDYQTHPQHIEFVEKVFKHTCKRALIYDFE
jgi:hypothetical protein